MTTACGDIAPVVAQVAQCTRKTWGAPVLLILTRIAYFAYAHVYTYAYTL